MGVDHVRALADMCERDLLALDRIHPGSRVGDLDLDRGIDRGDTVPEGLHDANDRAVVESRRLR